MPAAGKLVQRGAACRRTTATHNFEVASGRKTKHTQNDFPAPQIESGGVAHEHTRKWLYLQELQAGGLPCLLACLHAVCAQPLLTAPSKGDLVLAAAGPGSMARLCSQSTLPRHMLRLYCCRVVFGRMDK